MARRLAALVAACAAVAPGAFAVPADPTVHELCQPDGTTFEARRWGDEWENGWETTEGYTVVYAADRGAWTYATLGAGGRLEASEVLVGEKAAPREALGLRPAALGVQALGGVPPGPDRAVAATGTASVPVLLVTFADRQPAYGPAAFQELLFGSSSLSMRGYYQEVSRGRFSVASGPSGIGGWYTASEGHDYYGANRVSDGKDAWPGDLVYEAAVAADRAGFDFSPYDSDGDCVVDVLVVVHQGPGEDSSGEDADIWSHKWSLDGAKYYGRGHYGAYTTNDYCSAGGYVKVNTYTLQPETRPNGSQTTVGVYTHEFGHALGLPDLYDTDGSSKGIGTWGLMANGSWNRVSVSGDRPAHMSAWSKLFLGWVTPAMVTATPQTRSISAVETSGSVLQLRSGSPAGGGEYFLLENRQKTGFDAGLPGDGLLVWHVDEAMEASDNDDECVPPGAACAGAHYRVTLVQSDGSWDLERNANSGDTGDPYPGVTGNTTFTYASEPSSALWDGSDSGVVVSGISASAATMTADFGSACGSPGPAAVIAPEAGSTVTGPVVTLRWTAAAGAASYEVYLGDTTSQSLAGTTTSTSYAVQVVQDRTYAWRVVARSACGGTAESPAGGTWRFRTRAALSGMTTVMSDDFEASFPGGWAVWPSTGTAWGRSTRRSAGGAGSAWCAAGGSSPAPSGGPYAADMGTWLTYGPFSLATATAATLEFDLWKDTEAGADHVWWLASTDNETYYGSSSSGAAREWVHVRYDLDGFTSIQPLGADEVWIGFYFESDDSTQAEGPYIDNVVVRAGSGTAPTCSFGLSASSVQMGAAGGTGSVFVTAPAGCSWTASSPVAWVALTAGTSGSGDGTVSFTVSANSQASPRSASLSVAGKTFTVTQSGVSCAIALQPSSATVSAAASDGQLSVSTATGCTWTAGSNAAWITLTSASSGSGPGTLAYHVQANSGSGARVGTITVSGTVFTLTQSGASQACVPPQVDVEPADASVTSGGRATFTLQASGTAPLSYQWFRDEGAGPIAISGADGASYTTEPLTGGALFAALVTNGCGSVWSRWAQASVTGTAAGSTVLVPSVAHWPGAGGTAWRTDLAVVNPGTVASLLEFTFYDVGGATRTRSVAVAPAGMLEWRDAVVTLFDYGVSDKRKGTVVVQVQGTAVITTRTYNQESATRTFGQFYPAITEDDALPAGTTGYLPQIRSCATFRTNVGFGNPTATAADVRITLHDTDGAVLGSPTTVRVAALRWTQVDNVFAACKADDREAAYATVEVLTTGARVWAYASVVDNDSGDPTTIPATAVP